MNSFDLVKALLVAMPWIRDAFGNSNFACFSLCGNAAEEIMYKVLKKKSLV